MKERSPEYHLTIHDLPSSERPRERLRNYGASALSNAELLAILLRTGTTTENVLSLASRLLVRFKGLGGLIQANFTELFQEKGVGEAKAAQVKAALELGRRAVSSQPEARPVIRTPQDVANLLQGEMGFLEQEHLRLILLNTKNEVLGIPEIYKGSVNTSVIRVGELYREAIREGCPAIIVVHNHPSGDPTPSPEDVAVTKQMVEAGRLLDIEVLDHVIIGRQRFISLKERGLGFS